MLFLLLPLSIAYAQFDETLLDAWATKELPTLMHAALWPGVSIAVVCEHIHRDIHNQSVQRSYYEWEKAFGYLNMEEKGRREEKEEVEVEEAAAERANSRRETATTTATPPPPQPPPPPPPSPNTDTNLVTTHSLFEVASVSKVVTGTLFMHVWQERGFPLDEPLERWLPYRLRNPRYPEYPITPLQLLSHTSSIRDNWDILNTLIVHDRDSSMPLASLVRQYAAENGSLFNATNNFGLQPPGESFAYCNVNFAVLGHLIEVITNSSFHVECERRIFKPLGIETPKDAAWFLANFSGNYSNLATAHTYNETTHVYDRVPWLGFPGYPNGQLKISARALGRILRAHVDDGKYDESTRLLRSYVTRMIYTYAPFSFINANQKLALYSRPYGNRMVTGHSGGMMGARAHFWIGDQVRQTTTKDSNADADDGGRASIVTFERRVGVVLLANSDGDVSFAGQDRLLNSLLAVAFRVAEFEPDSVPLQQPTPPSEWWRLASVWSAFVCCCVVGMIGGIAGGYVIRHKHVRGGDQSQPLLTHSPNHSPSHTSFVTLFNNENDLEQQQRRRAEGDDEEKQAIEHRLLASIND